MAFEAAQLEQDRALLNQLASEPCTELGLVHCCRLLMRYQAGVGEPIGQQALATLDGWGLNQDAANALCRDIWAAGGSATGFRPPLEQGLVGSGADAAPA